MLSIDNLILEVTRRCNFSCAHCLRGDAQKRDISPEVIDRLLDGVESIGTVTFTGGEPSLNVAGIRYFLEACRARGVYVGSFYIATNGGKTSGSDDFLRVVMDLYIFCGDNEVSAVDVSNDDWHDNQPRDEEAIKRLECLRFVNIKPRLDYRFVIGEGRGKKLNEWNGVTDGERKARVDALNIEDDRIEGELYINVLGDVVGGCDLSYLRQARNKLGNILEKSLAEIVPAAEAVEV